MITKIFNYYKMLNTRTNNDTIVFTHDIYGNTNQINKSVAITKESKEYEINQIINILFNLQMSKFISEDIDSVNKTYTLRYEE